jgi:thiamine biosynthesis lipoprotein
LLLSLWLAAAAPGFGAEPQRLEFTQPQMGVPFRIVLYAANPATAAAAATAAFERIAQLNGILSDYETDSELNALSASAGQGRWVKLSDDLWRVLEQAQNFAARSGGAFDVTVGPYASLWRRARQKHHLPPADLLAEARRAVGYKKLRLDPQTHSAKLLAPDMRLDLGGIGKGYGVDEALKVLRARGIRQALVAGAGDMAMGDPPPGKKGWRIEVAPLDAPGAPPARFVLLANAALATSGDLFQRLEIDGQRYSHVVDPRTGVGLTDHSLVTVIATNCTTADALTKGVSVLGPKKGLKLIERTPGAAAHVVRQPAESIKIYESKHFREFDDPEQGGGD